MKNKSNGILITLCILLVILIFVILYAVLKLSYRPTISVISAGNQPTSITAQQTPSSLATENADGLDCKTTADQAAKEQLTTLPEGDSTMVLKTHFSQTFNQCYYEILTVELSDGVDQTAIDVAPDDDSVAWCVPGSADGVVPTECAENDNNGPSTTINQQQFHQLENEYLTN